MLTLHFVKRSLLFAPHACAIFLLTTVPAAAQEVIDLPGEDHWLGPHFEEVYRIGTLFGEEWQEFGRVPKVAFDGVGQLYVFDSQTLHIHVVDGSGGLRRTLGGPGDGPGEIRRAQRFVVMPNGRVVVGDTGHLAYQLFDANGPSSALTSPGKWSPGTPSSTAGCPRAWNG